ncbi:MAG: nucleoside 2-deoxyribosyltransferase [Magnetococcus sp. WYHC-3]
MNIYFAAPWFTPEQMDIHSRVHDVLKASRHRIFSPKHEMEVSHDAPASVRRRAFVQNLVQIQNSDFILAVTDYKDVGTIFECGYAFRSGRPILYYAETLGDRPFNLMLAESGIRVVRATTELAELLDRIESKRDLQVVSQQTYEGSIE